MSLFSRLYDKVMTWSLHPRAPGYLVGLSFAESSFFPIPPDVMLAPMSLAKPERAWYYAMITTIASVLGGIAGFLIGMFAFDLIQPYLHKFGYWERFLQVKEWFNHWGFWAIFIAGFSPIPYKVFTISAGVIAMSMPLFILASIIGRGARFFLVAGLMIWGGEKMQQTLRIYIDRIGWLVIIAVVLIYLLTRH